VGFTADIFEALDLQEELQMKYTGGTVFHAFVGEAIDDWKAVRSLVQAIAVGYRIPYFTITPTFSVCPVHGYLKGRQHNCPTCKDEEQAEIRKRIRELEEKRDMISKNAS
jgi:anaerobic ribonucleoside-triphosphate reductase